MIWLGIMAVVAAALAGAPLLAVLMGAAMLGFLSADIDLAIVAIEVYRIVDTPLLVRCRCSPTRAMCFPNRKRPSASSTWRKACSAGCPAGLAVVGFVVCAVFTALTGASGVTIVALGALLLPALVKAGFRERFSLGLVTTSGSLGLLMVPSVPLILYGIIVQQMGIGEPFTIVDLFMAGILPLLLMLTCLVGWTLWLHRDGSVPRTPFAWSAVGRALIDARWELPLPLVVLGGIYSGYFAISEAAAVTAVYVTVAQVALYRDIRIAELPRITIDAMVMVGGILLVLGVALAFTNFLVDAEVPQRLFEFMQSHIDSAVAFLLLLNILLLALGAMLDIFSALVIMVPLILPAAVGYGIHPIHLGIIFLANMQIGYFTPPVGMNLFIASYRFKKPVLELYAACWPFMVVLLIALLLITYVPWFSLALVR